MRKVPKCNTKGCDESRLKKPGNNTLYFRYCAGHQIKAVLSKQEEERHKDIKGLEKMRQNPRKTPQERFYQSRAWLNCSRYVLLHYADDDLMVRCCTSPHLQYHITDKSIHCGHFHKSDQHKSVALEFKNLAPQSYSDNIHFSGKPEIMAQWIERTHGEGTLEWLDRKKNQSMKLDKYTLGKISKHYLKLFNAELERRGIESPWK